MKHITHYKLLWALLLLFLSIAPIANAQSITTSLSRHQISAGETFKLTVTIDGQTSNQMADTAPLGKDFMVLSNTVFPQMTVINGKVDARTDFIFTLAPKKNGKLTIPALNIAGQMTKPVTITVKPQSTKLNPQEQRAIFLNAKLDTKAPYVQGQMIYTLRLFFSVNIPRGNFTPPQVDNAIIMPLGKDKEYQKTLNDKQYQVHERRYAIFPEQSGPLMIGPAVFSGIKETRSSYRNQINPFFSQTEAIRIVSPAFNVKVKPIPTAMQNQEWLPSKNVTLKESWNFSHQPPQAGEPIIRTITLKAAGVTAAQLPKLNVDLPANSNTNVYPDNPQQQNLIINNSVVAEKKQSIAYIPTTTGQIVLPEIRVQWWDTNNDRLVMTTLPSKSITLTASKLSTKEQTPSQPTSDTNTPIMELQPKSQHETNYWPYIALAILLIWFTTLFFFFRHRGSKKSQTDDSPKAMLSERKILQQLKIACQQHNAEQAKTYLLAWTQIHWPTQKTINLGIIAQQIDDKDLQHEITRLNQYLYSKRSEGWQNNKLWAALQSYLSNVKKKIKTHSSALPPLNPV